MSDPASDANRYYLIQRVNKEGIPENKCKEISQYAVDVAQTFAVFNSDSAFYLDDIAKFTLKMLDIGPELKIYENALTVAYTYFNHLYNSDYSMLHGHGNNKFQFDHSMYMKLYDVKGDVSILHKIHENKSMFRNYKLRQSSLKLLDSVTSSVKGLSLCENIVIAVEKLYGVKKSKKQTNVISVKERNVVIQVNETSTRSIEVEITRKFTNNIHVTLLQIKKKDDIVNIISRIKDAVKFVSNCPSI